MASRRFALLGPIALLFACGSTGALTPSDPAGAGGADSSAGGTGGDASSTGGAPGVGGSAQAGTTASAGKGGSGTGAAGSSAGGGSPFGGMTGTGGKGASAGAGPGTGGGPFGGGGAGSGGTSSGGTSSGGNIIPQTCAQAHDAIGCCGPDGQAYYCPPKTGVLNGGKPCTNGKTCGWDTTNLNYNCVVSPGKPPKSDPISCGP